ncbi:hypothetical protein ACAW74_26030 [Fibrella sp. WM1]|uniref:hypothetical protein n=1 Tax=Fibrella musci TaxID=3242485 RepID=UPI0035227B24
MVPSELIDQLLTDTLNYENWSFSEEDPENLGAVLDKAVAYGLIRGGYQSQTVTQRGYEVLEAGGFDKWRTSIKQREDEAHQAALESAKATNDAAKSAKVSARIALLTGVIAIIPIAISVLQYLDSQSVEKEINDIRQQLKTQGQQSLTRKVEQVKALTRTDSLTNHIE